MPSDRPTARTLSLFDEPSLPVLEGALQWVPVRQRLGVRAFGTNAYRAARAGDEVVEDHDESGGHEEAYVVVRGGARFEVGGEAIDAPAGTVVFLPDHTVRRHAVATEDETVVLAIGGWPDRRFEPSPWEPIFLAHDALRRRAWGEALETIEAAADERQRDSGAVRYQVACCLARLGEHDRAVGELALAVQRDPERVRGWAEGDEDLDPLRERPDWPL